MFFDNIPLLSKKAASLKRPPIPDTGWKPPSELPDLSTAAVISFDVETKELDFNHGPGWSRNKGHVVGASVAAAWNNGMEWSCYLPVRHEVEADWNLDSRVVFGWLKHVLETPHIPKVGANLLYDIGWLTTENIYVEGELFDVQFAEALLDDTALVALEVLAQKYCMTGKDSRVMYEWLAAAYGGKVGPAQRANIYRCPPRLAGAYGEADATLPLRIYEQQHAALIEDNTYELFRMECRSIPMLVRMRMAGVQINLVAAEKLYAELAVDIANLYDGLRTITGVNIESVSAGAQVAKCFDACGVVYPQTEAGSPSFQKEWLKSQTHPVAAAINDIREHEKMRNTFIGAYILDSHNNGRIHCQFHPLKSDDGGAKTGRYASSHPNLQNIPARTALGKKIRKLFVPQGMCWEKDDHSQIEYRMLANFATGPGADTLRQTYRDNPRTDYHDRVFKQYCETVGLDYAGMAKEEKATRRRPLKNVNFGLIYGQTEKSLAYKAGMSADEAKSFFAAYHEAAPYIKPTMAVIAAEVQANGYSSTLMGRRVRFELWEPLAHKGKRERPLPYEIALETYGHAIKRAGDYKGTNYKFQGSAADVMKAGMLKAYQEGVFEVTGMPLMQVHDELDFDVIDDSPMQKEAYKHLRYCLENATKDILDVPLYVDSGRGPNWGSVE